MFKYSLVILILFINTGSYLSTAAEEVGAENFFAQESKLDLANVCAESNTDIKSNTKIKERDVSILSEDETEDPALIEMVKNNKNLVTGVLHSINFICTIKSVEIFCYDYITNYQFQEGTMDDPVGELRTSREWTQFRMNAVKTCQILMGRPLQEWEKEVFLFPRTCRVCHTSRNKPNMIDCFACLGVTYCSQEHQEKDKNHHAKFCQELKYAMVSFKLSEYTLIQRGNIIFTV